MATKHTPGPIEAAKEIVGLQELWFSGEQQGREMPEPDEQVSAILAIIEKHKTPEEKAAPTLQARIDSLEAEKAELVEVLQKTLDEYIAQTELPPEDERALEKEGLGVKHNPVIKKAIALITKAQP